MRMLIIGSQGMLGQEFMKQLRGQDVVGWGRDDLDIANEQEVIRKVAALTPQVIINCAAYNNVDKAEDEPEVAMAINGEAVGHLARAAVDCGATFAHFSTDYVFDGTRESGYYEDDAPSPISAYGRSKVLGEERLLEIFGGLASGSNRRQGLPVSPWYLIRTSKLFGPAGSGATSKKSFPEIMIQIARAKGRVEAVDAEAGSPTHVKDLVHVTLELIGVASESSRRRSLSAATPGIYHLTNSGSCSWYEYAKAALEFAGLTKEDSSLTQVKGLSSAHPNIEVIPVGPDHFPRKARRPAHVVLLNTKLPPLRPWQEALREFLTQT